MLRHEWDSLTVTADETVINPLKHAFQTRAEKLALLKASIECLDNAARTVAAVRGGNIECVKGDANDSRPTDAGCEMSYLEDRYPECFERFRAADSNVGNRGECDKWAAVTLLSDLPASKAANESDPWLPPWQPWWARRAA